MENLTHEEKLKTTVSSEAYKICRQIEDELGVEFDKPSLKLISELTWKRLKTMSEDLEQFAKHAKRSTINSDDVKLLVRRNPAAKEIISSMTVKKRPSKDAEFAVPRPVEDNANEIDMDDAFEFK